MKAGEEYGFTVHAMNDQASFSASSQEIVVRIAATPGGGNQRGAAWLGASPNQAASPRNHGGGQGVGVSGPPQPTLLSLEAESLSIKWAPDPHPHPHPQPHPHPYPNPNPNPNPNRSGGTLPRAGRSGTWSS